MSEIELIAVWARARQHIIVAQVAPTLLLAASVVFFIVGIGFQPFAVRLAFAGILLASGILGALAEFSAAQEGSAAARDLAALPPQTALGRTVARQGPWMRVVMYVTPAVFIVIFAAELIALFGPVPRLR